MSTQDYSKKAILAKINPANPTQLTAALTDITHTDPGTPDYAIQDLTSTGGYGFVTKDEGNTALKVIANLQERVAALEAIVVAMGAAEAAE